MIYLEIPTSKHALIEYQGLRNKIRLRELYVGIAVVALGSLLVCSVVREGVVGLANGFLPFRMSSELVQQDCDPVDRSTALKMCLDFLRGCAIIHIADENTARIDIFLVLSQVIVLLVQGCLHFSQLCGLGFHLGYPSLHC